MVELTNERPFPPEIVQEILLRLPLNMVCRNKLVCKEWHELVKDDFFVENLYKISSKNLPSSIVVDSQELETDEHTLSFEIRINHNLKTTYPRPFKKMGVVGIVNGMICLAMRPMGDIITLWNPCTCEILEPPIVDGETSLASIGLAYGIEGVVVIKVYASPPQDAERVEVFSTKDCRWKTIQNTTKMGLVGCSCDTVVDGMPYWLTFKINDNSSDIIFYFDRIRKIFNEIRLPVIPYSAPRMLSSRDNTLSLLVRTQIGLQIWVHQMEGWIKERNVDVIPAIDRIINSVNSGDIVAEMNDGNLVLWDESITEIKASIFEPANHAQWCFDYWESLVDLGGIHYLEEFLKRESSRSRGGIPFMNVVTVGLLDIFLGYLLKKT